LTREWGRSAKQDIYDNTDRPDVTFASVLLVEDLWSDVVRSSEFLVEFLGRVKDKRGSKIDDLDLIEGLVLLK
jgi:hypothetical protein